MLNAREMIIYNALTEIDKSERIAKEKHYLRPPITNLDRARTISQELDKFEQEKVSRSGGITTPA